MFKIGLPENDERVIAAAKVIEDEGIAEVVDLSSTTVSVDDLVSELAQCRGFDTKSEEELAELINTDSLVKACLLLRIGRLDAVIAGAVKSTADVLRAGIKIVGMTDSRLASSFFIMQLRGGRTLYFADCAVNIAPGAAKLAKIASDTASSVHALGEEPRVAFLSFATKDSASHETVDAVTEAVKEFKKLQPGIAADGPVQVDVALINEVAAKKDPGSIFEQSPANIFIFPDLQSGNIGYKLVERLAGALAIGPILQGFNKPIQDLSRGCSVQDIVESTKLTVRQLESSKS